MLSKNSVCSKCNKDFDRGKYLVGIGWICEGCLGHRVKLRAGFWDPSHIKEQRKKHKRDLIQPFRENEFSDEFKETYPKQAKGMLDSGSISKKDYKEAKKVWD